MTTRFKGEKLGQITAMRGKSATIGDYVYKQMMIIEVNLDKLLQEKPELKTSIEIENIEFAIYALHGFTKEMG